MLAKLRDTAERLDALAEISEEILSKLTFIEYSKSKEEAPLNHKERILSNVLTE